MKTTVLSAALAALLTTLCPAQYDPRFPKPDAEADQTSTTVVHRDETYTTTERDVGQRKLVRQTMKKNGTVIMRSVFTLDEFGRERRGKVLDGRGTVLFQSVFVYDELGKLLEERVYDRNNQPVRRLVYQPDRLGGRKAFCHNYSGGRPAGGMMALDDPSALSTTSTHAHSSTGSPGEVIRSADGSSVRLGGGAVPYPGTRRAEESKAKRETSSGRERKRRLRGIFGRNR